MSTELEALASAGFALPEPYLVMARNRPHAVVWALQQKLSPAQWEFVWQGYQLNRIRCGTLVVVNQDTIPFYDELEREIEFLRACGMPAIWCRT